MFRSHESGLSVYPHRAGLFNDERLVRAEEPDETTTGHVRWGATNANDKGVVAFLIVDVVALNGARPLYFFPS